MSNEQLLKKIIEKAENNGFNFTQIWSGLADDYSYEIYTTDDENIVFNIAQQAWTVSFFTLFFNHNFAKAYFGIRRVSLQFNSKKGGYYYKYWSEEFGKEHGLKPAWEYFLQELVLEKNHLKYLKQFL